MHLLLIRFFILFLFLLPSTAWGQVTDRVEPPRDRIPATVQASDPEPREIHYTHILLDSNEGREALQEFRQLRDSGNYPLMARTLSSNSIGDIEQFFVRNIEESTVGDPVFDEIEFELVRSGDGVEVWVEVEELGEDRISEQILDVIWNGLINETPVNSIDPNRGVIEIGRDLFGEQPNVDGSGIVKVLIADIQDGWDPPDQNFFTAGFFDPVNLSSTHESSNQADIIYINSMPGIYREEAGFVNSRLSTMAHEFQHLIHANYGNLSLYQNEGQSEIAEILSGFGARAMNFLDSGSELSGNVSGTTDGNWVYRFRSTDSETVLYDYQRAQLMHSYLEERLGSETVGELTQSNTSNDAAYRQILDPANITLQEFFTDFYISAYANNRVSGVNDFAFSRPQLANIRTSNPGVLYNAMIQPWVIGREELLYYGGALYTQWFGVEDLRLNITSSDGITQNLLYRMQGQTEFSHMPVGTGEWNLDESGVYEEIVLVSVNTEPSGSSASPQDNRTFSYNGQWTTTDLVIEPLVYHSDAAAYFPLPDDEVYSFALRISPDFDSGVHSVRFNINARETAVQGEGELRLTLRESEERTTNEGELIYIPTSVIAEQALSVNDISTGENYIGVNSTEWVVEEGNEYFITIEVVEDHGNLYIEFLLDDGTENTTDINYNPTRTFVGLQEDGELTGWASFTNRNNILMGVNLVGFKDIAGIDFPDPPVSDIFELVKNYPNPFNSGTVIQYNVPEDGVVRITVHDVLGREVMELFNNQVVPGLHEVQFDAGSLASGVYFYRMISPDGIQTRKMMLVK